MKTFSKNVWIIYGLIFLLAGCGKGTTDGQDLSRMYHDYHNAIQEEDLEALKDFLTSGRQKEILGEGAGMKLKMAKEFLPSDINVTKTTVSGTTAVLEVEGRMQGQKMTGTVEFLKEEEEWKISKENWTMTLEMDAGQSTGFAAAAEPFIKDPKEPPRPYKILTGHQGNISGLAFTPDSRFLVSVGYGDYSLRVWDTVSGEEISTEKTQNRVRGLAMEPYGRSVLTADAYNNIILWPLENGIIGTSRVLNRNAGDKLAVSPDGKYFVTTGWKKPLQLWDFQDGTLIKKLTGDTNLRTLTFSKSGKWLANGSKGNTYTLWNTKKWKPKEYRIRKVSKKSDVSSIDISSDEKYMATGHMDSSIVIFDLDERKELHNFYVRNAATWDVKFTPDCKYLATAQQDKTIYLWEVRTAKSVAKLKKHTEAVTCLAFSPDGTTLASAGEDRKIFLWRSGSFEEQPLEETPAVPSAPTTAPAPEPGIIEVEGRKNLIKNPYADQQKQSWKTKGDVFIWVDKEGNPYFAVTYSGMFWQDVPIPGSSGRWVLLIAWSSSERINQDDDQTGLPYLYGYMINSKDSRRIDAYLSGQNMVHSEQEPNEWGVIWGVFQVPGETGAIRFFMQQADGSSAQNGSAACFDDPGVFLFDTKEEARAFVDAYK